MIKLRMTESFNIILALVGVLVSLGVFINQSEAYPIFFFAVLGLLIFLTRTRFWYIPTISLGISIFVYIVNFAYFNGFAFSFYTPEWITITLAVISCLMFVAYGILNYLIMIKRLPAQRLKRKKKEKVYAN